MPNMTGTRSSKKVSKKSALPSKSTKVTSSEHHTVTSGHVEMPQMQHTGHHASKHPYDQMNFDDRGATSFNDLDMKASVHTPYQEGYQLQLWAYETSNTDITVTERFEKANWTVERLERL